MIFILISNCIIKSRVLLSILWNEDMKNTQVWVLPVQATLLALENFFHEYTTVFSIEVLICSFFLPKSIEKQTNKKGFAQWTKRSKHLFAYFSLTDLSICPRAIKNTISTKRPNSLNVFKATPSMAATFFCLFGRIKALAVIWKGKVCVFVYIYTHKTHN